MNVYDHHNFKDVLIRVHAKFYIPEKDMWSLKVQWFHKRGWSLCTPYRIKITNDKFKEFTAWSR